MNDTIYRQDAIDVFDVGKELLSCALDNMDIVDNDREKFEWGLGLIESYIEDIKDIPSAQPQWKKGKWMPVSDETQTWYHCSECHYQQYEKTKFCPSCGADMRGESDES